MEIITSGNTNTTTNNNNTAKSPEPETETPTRIQQQPINTNTNTKPLSFSNGVLKRHHPTHHHTHTHHPHPHPHPLPHATNQAVVVTYKECLKNHVANLGGHALDGCGEFMPSPNANENDPSSIKCAACGCHRNFHRREPEEPIAATHVFEYQPHHRHHPPPPPPFHNRSPNSASPPPISSYPSAPHMLLALSGGGLSVPPENTAAPTNLSSPAGGSNARKRFRTKFTQEQKEKMHEFAERVGWKMQKRDEELVMEFCNEVGVDRGVLKVWMHNNKNTLGKRDHVNANGAAGGGDGDGGGGHNPNGNNIASQDQNQYENDSGTNVATNGSSSSS